MKYKESYWSGRYEKGDIPWDVGSVTSPIKAYFSQLEGKEKAKILIPGAGNGYEGEYLHRQGYMHVHVIDLSSQPLQNLALRCPDFPKENLIQGDFFAWEGQYDYILEQTFFCALHPSQRQDYALAVHRLLKVGGKLVGVLFDAPLNEDRPPFGGNLETYGPFFKDYFRFKYFDACYNSIPPRAGRELFICLEKK